MSGYQLRVTGDKTQSEHQSASGCTAIESAGGRAFADQTCEPPRESGLPISTLGYALLS
jgi:hypothetical protein